MDTMLLGQRRRNRRMNASLVGAALAASVAVSNERGVFVPIGGIDDAVAATARAFTATAAEPVPQIDTLYTPPVALRQAGGAPAYRRIVDVPGDPAPTMFDQPQAFSARATDETPAADGASAAGGPAIPAGTSPTVASLVAPTPNTPAIAGQPARSGGTSTIDATAPTTSPTPPAPAPDVAAIPEPASWLTMIAGFGMVGALRRRGRTRPTRQGN